MIYEQPRSRGMLSYDEARRYMGAPSAHTVEDGEIVRFSMTMMDSSASSTAAQIEKPVITPAAASTFQKDNSMSVYQTEVVIDGVKLTVTSELAGVMRKLQARIDSQDGQLAAMDHLLQQAKGGGTAAVTDAAALRDAAYEQMCADMKEGYRRPRRRAA